MACLLHREAGRHGACRLGDLVSTWLFTPRLLPFAIARPTPRRPPVNRLAPVPLMLDGLFTTQPA